MDIIEKIDIILTEGMMKKVIRGGKVVRKLICPQGFKAKGKKCVRMKGDEMRKRKKSAIIAQKKLQGKTDKKEKMMRKRAKSMKKRGIKIPDVFPTGNSDPMKF